MNRFFFSATTVTVLVSGLAFAEPKPEPEQTSESSEAKKKPKILKDKPLTPGVVPEGRHFSPNLDGVKDTLNIPLSIKDPSRLKFWNIHIGERAKGMPPTFNLVRTLRSEPRREITKMTVAKFWNKLISAKERIVVPQVVRWDGEVSSELADGRKGSAVASDGVYYIQIEAADEYGNTTKTRFIPIVVDTQAPEMEVRSEATIFSPNGDGKKETLAFDIEVFESAAPYDSFDYQLTDAEGGVEAEMKGSVDLLGKPGRAYQFVWDGNDKQGKPSPEGVYSFVLNAHDRAGNKFFQALSNLTLVRVFETASLALSADRLSPDNNNLFDEIVFTVGFSATEHMESWQLNISDESGEVVQRLERAPGDLGEVSYAGSFEDGEAALPEGSYEAQLVGSYRSGNQPVSERVGFVLDLTPPKIGVRVQQKYFLPSESTASNRSLLVEHIATEEATYRGFVKDEYGNIVLIREYEGVPPSSFAWDGTNLQGTVVPGRYTYTLVGEDDAGNSAEADSQSFELVTKKADISVRSERLAFSPNGDGRADKMPFLFDSNKKERIISTKLEIYNAAKKTIKTLTARGYSERIEWNGENQRNELVAEGRYFYRGSFVMGSGEEPVSDFKPLYLDLTPVKLSLSLRANVFSPNADGKKDFLFVDQEKSASDILDGMDVVRLSIVDRAKVAHKSLEWTGTPPKGTKWNGRNDDGKPVPEGAGYRYVLETSDHAGNAKTYASKPFAVVLSRPVLSLSLSGRHLTYEATSYAVRSLLLSPSLAYKASVIDRLDRLSYRLVRAKVAGEFFLIHDAKKVAALDWGGRTTSKERLPNGTYNLVARAEYASGNEAVAIASNVVIDSEPPKIALRSQPEYFSPDGDGLNERLQVRVNIKEANGLRESKALLYRKVFMRDKKLFEQSFSNYASSIKKPFMSWDLKGELNTLIEWDGRGAAGDLVESANDYMLFALAVDEAGNVGVQGLLVQVDVLVEKLADGRLRIILNSLNFVFDSTKLIGDYQKTLDRLVYILYKFPKYKIHLIGHTDSQGTDDYNQTLSEERAEVVFNYLRREGIREERMTWEGRGETELLNLKGITEVEEIHRRNRRVEIYLNRDGQ